MTLEAVVIVVGVIATVISVIVVATRLPAAERPPPPRRGPPRRSRPSQLLRIERIVERSGEDGRAAHTLLRPVLVEIATARLARRGVQLDRDHDEAQRLLGPDAWELVRPDRPPPHDHRVRGVSPRELEAMLDRLEAL
jgi:hypothetical protein